MRIGIDLGGTKIEIMAINDDDEVLVNRRVPTPRHDYSKTLDAIAQLVLETEQEIGQQASIGIGMPGSLSKKTGLIKNANSTWLNEKAFDKDLEQRLQRNIRIANDANCLVWSETVNGAAKAYDNVFGVILGSGVGGGLVIHNQLVAGINGIAGEWGHNPLPWKTEQDVDLPCYCGKSGCIETYLSGIGFAQHFHKQYPEHSNRRSEDIIQAYRSGETAATEAFNLYINQLARALACVVNIIDPDIIVLGGGMSNIQEMYAPLKQQIPDYVFSDYIDIDVVPAQYGDSSGIRGAAWLWPTKSETAKIST